MTSGIFLNLIGFRFSDIAAINAGDSLARMMNAQHYLHRVFFVFAKNRLSTSTTNSIVV